VNRTESEIDMKMRMREAFLFFPRRKRGDEMEQKMRQEAKLRWCEVIGQMNRH
jgi:hypothetical protein